MRRVAVFFFMLSLALASIASATETESCLRGVTIPCIQSFHDAMAPSCHKYIPAGDFTTARKHIPNMVALSAPIAALRLDSTYTAVDKDFQIKRALFLASVNDLKTAGEKTDDAALKAAFEKMEGAFAVMNSTLRASQSALDEFHTILAKVWHTDLPARNYAAIKSSLGDLRQCGLKLKTTGIPSGTPEQQRQYALNCDSILAAISAIEKVIDSGSDDKIQKAVTDLHEAYRALSQAR